jgi:hypothetical protein
VPRGADLDTQDGRWVPAGGRGAAAASRKGWQTMWLCRGGSAREGGGGSPNCTFACTILAPLWLWKQQTHSSMHAHTGMDSCTCSRSPTAARLQTLAALPTAPPVPAPNLPLQSGSLGRCLKGTRLRCWRSTRWKARLAAAQPRRRRSPSDRAERAGVCRGARRRRRRRLACPLGVGGPLPLPSQFDFRAAHL